MAIPVVAALAAAGLVKGLMDKQREDADRRQAAEMTRWSPWTKMGPNQISRADVLGSTLQGGMAGAMMGGGNIDWGGTSAPAGGAMQTSSPAAAASMTGGQSKMPMPGSDAAMAQKYPWLGM